jgi:DNA segregation ATPase FtsK/SpoIIIE-like protein
MTLSTQQVLIGTRTSGEPVMLDPEERRPHLYVVGQTGTGKSTTISGYVSPRTGCDC